MIIKCGHKRFISLLLELEPENKEVRYYAGSILASGREITEDVELVDSP